MGHVHVVHGDLTTVQTDAVLVPCDRFGFVTGAWQSFLARPLTRTDVRDRVSDARDVDGRVVRFVNTGATEQQAGTANTAWLAVGVTAGVRAAVADLGDRSGTPLIGMPIFGVGAGGFDSVRGSALRAQLEAARAAVAGVAVDVAVVCFERADFAAVQRQRVDDDWPGLDHSLRAQADRLAAASRAGRLVLFLGAGVSIAAGIGGFESLVADLERRAGADGTDTAGRSLPERVDAVRERLGGKAGLAGHVADLVARPRASLGHALAASLRVREAVTTNFDALYELAAVRPLAPEELDVLPWGRSDRPAPWLLKAHGDPALSPELVLSADSYDAFDSEQGPTAGVLRALFALGREVLFVGYSLRDDNINRIVAEASKSHEKLRVPHRGLGTVLDIEAPTIDAGGDLVRIGLADVSGDVGVAARRLRVFLDRLVWEASRHESAWLLDERYDALHATPAERDAAAELRAAVLPETAGWQGIAGALRRFGRR